MCWVCMASRLRGSILVARRRRRRLTALRMRRKRSICRRLDRPLRNTTAASHHRDSTVGTRNSENSKLTSKNSCIKFALKSTYILCRTFNENLLACQLYVHLCACFLVGRVSVQHFESAGRWRRAATAGEWRPPRRQRLVNAPTAQLYQQQPLRLQLHRVVARVYVTGQEQGLCVQECLLWLRQIGVYCTCLASWLHTQVYNRLHNFVQSNVILQLLKILMRLVVANVNLQVQECGIFI